MDQRTNDTYLLMSKGDLIQLERWLGQGHPLCQRLREALADCAAPHLQEYRNAAMSRQCDGELEIDPGAVVSKGEQGAFVMAWLWIDASELAAEGSAQ